MRSTLQVLMVFFATLAAAAALGDPGDAWSPAVRSVQPQPAR